ncbi:MAG: redoxin domain-containing protein [Gammaproteobacteria bacterium]|jgi:thiol-disulfide isomerase/thioredoxin|nr:redoxin domain-containing protein [Gammaproteobacteria bacterium]
MKKFCNDFKQVLFIITICLITSSGVTVSASENTDKIKLPFGIRHYDIGTAQNFFLQDIDGENFELKSTKGHWVFLHFWASWCGPCVEEMPTIQILADDLQNENFQILMINTAEDEDAIFTFLGEMNIELNSLMDVDGQVTEAWKPRGLPTTFLINPQGEIKYQAIGGREWNKPEYIEFLKKLIFSTDERR